MAQQPHWVAAGRQQQWVVKITPSMAKRWLATQVRNRTLNQQKVAEYARDMAAGRWDLNGETIKFDTHDHLIDGQHRLAAVVQAGATVESVVVWGLVPETQDTVDIGKVRAVGDTLMLHGHRHGTTAGSVARVKLAYDRHPDKGWWPKGMLYSTRTEVAQYAETPEVLYAAGLAVHWSGVLAPASVRGAAFLIFQELDHEQARTFMDLAHSGSDLVQGHPLLALRARLSRIHGERTRTRQEDYLALLIRAWNGVRKHRSMARIELASGGTVQFPRAR